MVKSMIRPILGSLAICLAAQAAWAFTPIPIRVDLDLDQTYTRNLQWQASADKEITPAKVIRWMRGMHGEQLAPPSPIEFQPIVRSHNGQSEYIAALAYKF